MVESLNNTKKEYIIDEAGPSYLSKASKLGQMFDELNTLASSGNGIEYVLSCPGAIPHFEKYHIFDVLPIRMNTFRKPKIQAIVGPQFTRLQISLRGEKNKFLMGQSIDCATVPYGGALRTCYSYLRAESEPSAYVIFDLLQLRNQGSHVLTCLPPDQNNSLGVNAFINGFEDMIYCLQDIANGRKNLCTPVEIKNEVKSPLLEMRN